MPASELTARVRPSGDHAKLTAVSLPRWRSSLPVAGSHRLTATPVALASVFSVASMRPSGDHAAFTIVSIVTLAVLMWRSLLPVAGSHNLRIASPDDPIVARKRPSGDHPTNDKGFWYPP